MKNRIIAYYLPQFHPIPENDKYWGPGFTEWTNVSQARPLFKGHYQPHIPADLGFYDLRLPETRVKQAELAREAGIEGFCYYHYWLGNGKKLLERPFEEVLETGQPDFPFCLCWANHDWTTKTWKRSNGNVSTKTMIAKQLYPGEQDYVDHFNYLLPAFCDKRYIKVDGKPLFLIHDPYNFADVSHFMEVWRKLAKGNGFDGLYFVGVTNSTSTIKRQSDGTIQRVIPNLKSSKDVYNDIIDLGFDGVNAFGKFRAEMIYTGKYKRVMQLLLRRFFSGLKVNTFEYKNVVKNFFAPEDVWENVIPTIVPQWDRTPRVGSYDGVYVNATPEAFQRHVEDALALISKKQPQHRILMLRAWNEWGEGNYVEPDLKFGHGWLDAIRNALDKFERG